MLCLAECGNSAHVLIFCNSKHLNADAHNGPRLRSRGKQRVSVRQLGKAGIWISEPGVQVV